MINENEYNKFVNSVENFVGTCMHLWQQQFEINTVLQKQITEHLEIIKEYRDVLQLFNTAHHEQKDFLGDHEKRLLEIETVLSKDLLFNEIHIQKINEC